jgi:predicted nucleic acid-binding protein
VLFEGLAPMAPSAFSANGRPFLRQLAAGRADAIVTGDADLLVLAGQVGHAIFTRDAFLASLPAR